MKRVVILLLDSLGIGEAPDASKFSDSGSNTLRNIIKYFCSKSSLGKEEHVKNFLNLKNLRKYGLYNVLELASGKLPENITSSENPKGAYGCAYEISKSKDTLSGHWEMMGIPVLHEWGYFFSEHLSFPKEFLDEFIRVSKIPGIIGNKHASGTEIIMELGDEQIKSGKPIVYTSADSVFQIAAHEESFGLEQLYKICMIARNLLNKYNIGRVIARPFLGNSSKFYRTANRKDFSVLPPAPTLLNKLCDAGGNVISIGKISDIFADSGITKKVAHSLKNMELFDNVLNELKSAGDKSLIFANFVDFDMLFGHRRDPYGYGKALESFDLRLSELKNVLKEDDIVIITADHGCDPTFKGTDHTREFVPILIFGKKIKNSISIGIRTSFSDIGQTIAEYFSLKSLKYGESFLHDIIKK